MSKRIYLLLFILFSCNHDSINISDLNLCSSIEDAIQRENDKPILILFDSYIYAGSHIPNLLSDNQIRKELSNYNVVQLFDDDNKKCNDKETLGQYNRDLQKYFVGDTNTPKCIIINKEKQIVKLPIVCRKKNLVLKYLRNE